MPAPSDASGSKEAVQPLCQDDAEAGIGVSPRGDARSLRITPGVTLAALCAAVLLGGALAAAAISASGSAKHPQEGREGVLQNHGKDEKDTERLLQNHGKDEKDTDRLLQNHGKDEKDTERLPHDHSKDQKHTGEGNQGKKSSEEAEGKKSSEKAEGKKSSEKAEPECAGADSDCSSSQCCSEAGMQCYEREEGGAAFCKASCSPGPDFGSSKHQLWTCKELGERTAGSAEEASAPKVKFEGLPSWVGKQCSAHDDMAPEDCSKTMCCQESGMQCFQKEEGWAICDKECTPGERKGDGYWQCNRLGPQTPVQCPKCAPKSAPKPDIVILFFERDLCKMKYTARSIGVNDPDHNLGEVYLMWVSSNAATEYQDEIDEIKASIEEYKTVHFVDWSERMASAQPHPMGGWHAQQMVKLKIAHEVKSDFYIVLDSKNTLIRPVTPDMFFTECGQGKIQAEFPFEKIPVPHSDWYERSAKVLGLGPPDSGFWPASITPIVMHRQTVIEMLESIGEDPNPEELCNGPLCEQIGAFSGSGVGATEFTLYTLWAYAKRQNNTFDCIHSIQKLQHFKIKYSKNWKEQMQQQISGLGFPEDLQQITVSDGDGFPLDWTPDRADSEPTKDSFPLMFEDLTEKWASSLWRGEESNQDLLVQVNLHTLDDVVSGARQFPIMFGAQPASLKPMSEEERVVATDKLVKMYKKANLYDPEDDLVSCTIGWKN